MFNINTEFFARVILKRDSKKGSPRRNSQLVDKMYDSLSLHTCEMIEEEESGEIAVSVEHQKRKPIKTDKLRNFNKKKKKVH